MRREALVVFSVEVETYWATVFQCSADDLWKSGTFVSAHAGNLTDYRGVFVLYRRDACRVSAPRDLVEPLKFALQGRAATDVFRSDSFVDLLGDRVDRVIGPNWYGYVSEDGYRPAASRGCREIAADDAYALDVLRDACGMRDWAEGSFDRVPALFGCFEDDRLVAASNLTAWRVGDDRIGVVTHPEFRRRGYGAAVASAATERALRTTTVAEWRARGTNTASIELALKLGFARYGENLAIRLR